MAVPRTERIDTILGGQRHVALFGGIAKVGKFGGNVEEQAVVVFCPACTLHGYAHRTAVMKFLGGHSGIDGMRAEINVERLGLEADTHLPYVGIHSASAAAEGVVHTTEE